jgi:hypothetical protein
MSSRVNREHARGQNSPLAMKPGVYAGSCSFAGGPLGEASTTSGTGAAAYSAAARALSRSRPTLYATNDPQHATTATTATIAAIMAHPLLAFIGTYDGLNVLAARSRARRRWKAKLTR